MIVLSLFYVVYCMSAVVYYLNASMVFLMLMSVSLYHSQSDSGNTAAISGLYSMVCARCPYSTEKNARVIPHPQHSAPSSCLKRHVLLPLKMPSVGSKYNITGSDSSMAVLLLVLNYVAVSIGELAYDNHDEIDECPNSAASAGE